MINLASPLVFMKNVSPVALYECGITAKMIRKMVKVLSVNELFVSETLARY